MTRKYKKIDYDKVAEDDFNMKDYFKTLKVDFARSKFKIISHMMPLALSQKSNMKYKERGWICLGCKGTPSTGVSDGVDGGDGAEEVQEGEGQGPTK